MKNFLQKTLKAALVLVMLVVPFGSNAGVNDIFKGWSWTPFAGWISMNSTNQNAANSYGVTIDDSRNLTGYAWSSNLGWICFGLTCAGTPPGGGSSWALLDPSDLSSPQLFGWARIMSLSGGDSWIALNCKSYAGHPARDVCATAPGFKVWTTTSGLVTDGQFQGYAWNCATSDGSACTPAKYAGGIGWIHFAPVYTPPEDLPPGTYSSVPWVQVLYGDLYAKGNISTPSPFTSTFKQVNATYCIDRGVSSTVTHFTNDSTKCATDAVGSVSVNINLPKKGSNYSNILGRIKLRGYSAALQPLNVSQLAAGKFGPWQQLANQAALTAVPQILGGAVYDTTGSGTTSWTLGAKTNNNALASGNGSGLLIIRGNLTITGNIDYQIGSISNLKQLASLGILVLDDGSGTMGNITIAPGVTNISANIYSEGVIATGSTNDPTNEQPLVINGVVVAKQFNFQRQYQGTSPTVSSGPSEQIVNDGRIVVNTPPGMNDFVASLPSISY